MTAYTIVFMMLVIDIVVGIFGGYAGFTVNGVPVAEGGSIGIDSLKFLWAMITFQIDGLPNFVSAVFLVFNLLLVFVGIRTLRGND
jgi:hypothetical protein